MLQSTIRRNFFVFVRHTEGWPSVYQIQGHCWTKMMGCPIDGSMAHSPFKYMYMPNFIIIISRLNIEGPFRKFDGMKNP